MAIVELDYSISIDDIPDSNSHDEELNSFDCIDNGQLNYSDFFKKFLLGNRPCVIRGVTKEWKCQADWVSDDIPNFKLLSAKYGDSTIPTANCNEKYYNSHVKGSMKLSQYLDYWIDFKTSGYSAALPSLYLKDWHCFKEFPDEILYSVPEYFISDWLNEYYLNFPELNDDYRFVYMGPKGTWTPLHKDVFSSFSWSVNICGLKQWVFYHPKQVGALSDKLGNLAFDIVENGLSIQFPNLASAKCYHLEQGPGDAVFVPSGWYHQVWNKEDAISVNHNWVNGCNIEHMLLNLLSENENVEKELEDCRNSSDWHKDCQRLLKATFGLDLEQFFNFIEFIAQRRILAVKSLTDLKLSNEYSLGLNHILFDLRACRNILIKLLKRDYPCLTKEKIHSLFEVINTVLDVR